MTYGALALARDLIAIDTTNPPGGELRAAERIARQLRDGGIDTILQPLGDGRANLVARLVGAGERPALVFTGHLDTVPIGPQPWSRPPLDGGVDDGRLYGRGAVDMKGAVAAMCVALLRLRDAGEVPAGDVVLALTAGEEVDSCGAERLAQTGLLDGAGAMVVGEPTNFDVGIAHRGALWVRVAAYGTRAHGARPSRAANAIYRLFDRLDPLDELEALVGDREDPLLGSGSMSLNMVGGGDAPNVVPDLATATLDFRTLPGHRHEELLESLRARREGVDVTVLRDAPPIAVAADDPLPRAALDAVTETLGRPARTRGLAYVTDASAFVSALGIPAIVVGPGTEQQAHTVDEYVEVEALGLAADIYERIARVLAY
jgi:succinyl-diaminopimelate desuccinylase